MKKPQPGRKKPSLSDESIAALRDSGPIGRYLGSQLRLTHIAALNALQTDFSPFNSSPIRFALMDQVNELPGSTQATLADLLDVDRTTLVPMISDMERKGLFKKKTLSSDKRAVQIWITAKGKKLLEKLRPLAAAHEKKLCGDMSTDERETLIESLRQLRHNLSGF